MNNRRLHRLLGITMLLPFIAWALTAIFFLVRPGYTEAYAQLNLASASLPSSLQIDVDPQWQELRYASSPLGEHLLVRTNAGWQHLDGRTGDPFPPPDANGMQSLLEAATAANIPRFGEIASIDGLSARTTTGVEITVFWDTLSASQSGRDTRLINKIYDIHYLRWTGHAGIDQVVGVTGLVLLLLLTWTGATLVIRGRLPWQTGQRRPGGDRR